MITQLSPVAAHTSNRVLSSSRSLVAAEPDELKMKSRLSVAAAAAALLALLLCSCHAQSQGKAAPPPPAPPPAPPALCDPTLLTSAPFCSPLHIQPE